MELKKRLEELQSKLKEKQIEAMLITNPMNLCYITGFSGTSGVALVTKDRSILLTDFRYTEAAIKQAPYFEVIDDCYLMEETLNNVIKAMTIKSLSIEEDYVTYGLYKRLSCKLSGIKIDTCSGLIEGLRAIKENYEIEAIKIAAKVSDEALAYIINIIKPGMTEKEVSVELDYFVKKKGVEMFPRFIVASGYRSALPHGYASDKVIAKGEFLMIDFGAQYNGYYSDITRTFTIGKADQRQREIYDIVYNAQLNAVNTAAPSISYNNIYNAAVSIIDKAGYKLGHGLGHGLGLEIHELPFINNLSRGTIEKNITATIEPGIYIPGWGGVRIEDTVLITADGCVPLTKFSKELIEL